MFTTYKIGYKVGYHEAKKQYKMRLELVEKTKDEQIKKLVDKIAVDYARLNAVYRDKIDKMKYEHKKEIELLKTDLEKKYNAKIQELEREVDKYKKIAENARSAYNMFVDDLYEFSNIVATQAAEANIIAVKGAELLQVANTVMNKVDIITRSISKKDEKIKGLLYTKAV